MYKRAPEESVDDEVDAVGCRSGKGFFLLACLPTKTRRTVSE
jgi:hypothetical protein